MICCFLCNNNLYIEANQSFILFPYLGNSDLLTMYKAYTAWRDLRRTKSSQERDFCRRHFLSHQNLLAIEDTKKQLLGLLVAIGFVRMEGEEAVELSR